jgi:hypothetical protein
MNPTFRRILSVILATQLAGLPLSVVSQASPPVIVHEPVKVAARGQAKTIIARVSVATGTIQSVNLYVTQSADASPLKVEMKPSGSPGTYYGTIPSAYLESKGTIRYYIEALASDGEWKETNWMTLAVQDAEELGPTTPSGSPSGGTAIPAPESSSERPGWFWPTILIGGGALAVAGAVALADSGGDDGDSKPPVDGGDDNVAGRIITRTVRDDAEFANLTLPKDTVIDITSELNGRTVETVRVDLTLDAADTFADEAQIRYNGATVLETGPVTTSVSRSVTVSGTSPVITLRIVKSAVSDVGFQNYSLTATATFILKK